MKEVGHIIQTQDFRRAWLETQFFEEVKDMVVIAEKKPASLFSVLKGKKILLLFWKKSVRTSNMFEVASDMLGANTKLIEGEKNGGKWQIPYSSEIEGGYFEDLVRTFATKYDCIVIRHPEEGLATRAVAIIDKFRYKTKIINAGDGPGQHPIQAFIDLFSIKKDFGKIDGLTGVIMGDLLCSRAVHSLVYLLGKFNVKMFFVSPSKLKMPDGITRYLTRHGVEYKEICPQEISGIKKDFDFLYVVGVPRERHADNEMPIINKAFANEFLKTGSKVYHPFPRGKEITPWRYDDEKSQKETIDETEHAGYFDQMENGEAVLLAILKMALNPAIDLKELDDNLLLFTKQK